LRYGRDLLDRAPQADARLWRQGHPHAGRRARHRHGAQGEGTREKHGWFLARQFANPANPAYHRRPRRRKSCATSPAGASTISSPAGAPAAP
jgi:cysteine synthase